MSCKRGQLWAKVDQLFVIYSSAAAVNLVIVMGYFCVFISQLISLHIHIHEYGVTATWQPVVGSSFTVVEYKCLSFLFFDIVMYYYLNVC